jgi:hypothetical protein
MGVNPHIMELRFYDDATPISLQMSGMVGGYAAGLWEEGIVHIERGCLDRPEVLVGILAHELAHQRLLGEGRIDPSRFDNELLTDLTAIFHGFGVFLANNPRRSTGELGYWPKSSLRKPEYISEPMAGYAMAHLAWFRDEVRPQWARSLKWAMRGVFHQGLRYLQKTTNSTFLPVRFR